MKRLALLLAAAVMLCALLPCAAAMEEKEYRDEVYSFRYPADWSCGVADNGDIVLGPPDGDCAVVTFAVRSNIVRFTGDAEADASSIEYFIAQYGGKNLNLSGEYTLVEFKGLKGFRGTGDWRATGQDAVMIVLTGENHLLGFVLVGDDAIALEEYFLDSVELLGDAPGEGSAGFLRWQGPLFSVEYPEAYSVLEQNGAAVFIDPQNGSNIIMIRAYGLDGAYTDALAPTIAAGMLPKSTKVEPNPTMVEIGGRSAAVITGVVSNGPMAFYAFGGGNTAVVLMLMGEAPTDLADALIRSVEIY